VIVKASRSMGLSGIAKPHLLNRPTMNRARCRSADLLGMSSPRAATHPYRLSGSRLDGSEGCRSSGGKITGKKSRTSRPIQNAFPQVEWCALVSLSAAAESFDIGGQGNIGERYPVLKRAGLRIKDHWGYNHGRQGRFFSESARLSVELEKVQWLLRPPGASASDTTTLGLLRHAAAAGYDSPNTRSNPYDLRIWLIPCLPGNSLPLKSLPHMVGGALRHVDGGSLRACYMDGNAEYQQIARRGQHRVYTESGTSALYRPRARRNRVSKLKSSGIMPGNVPRLEIRKLEA
jgi:hypothetical protein